MNISPIEENFSNIEYIIGVDEAGRGPWAGPVTVGAVLVSFKDVKKLSTLPYLNDSKKLSPKRRKALETEIKQNVTSFEISDISSEIIDRINILEATKLGIKNVIKNLIQNIDSTRVLILIDGKFNNLDKLLHLDNIQTIIRGDSLCLSIASASILAKEHRDSLMLDYHKIHPEYSFDKHKGYGTQLHMQRIKTFGICPLHRKSFAPIKAYI